MEEQNPVQAQNQPLAPVQPQPIIQPTPPVQPEPPQPEIIKVPSSSSGFPFKRILILLIVLMIIVISGGAYILNKNLNKISVIPSPTPISTATATPTPTLTPDPTANWKTYANTKIGFQIKYPPRYSVPALPSGAPGSPTIYADKNSDNTDIIFGEHSDDSFGLAIFPFAEDVNSLKNTVGRWPISLPNQDNMTIIKTLEINGSTAQWYKATPKIIYPETKNDYDIMILFTRKEHAFILHTTSKYDENELNQIISTFKFTDQAMQSVLKIPEYGVQIALSNDIKDAYYINTTAAKGYVYLKVHSLDTEPQCKKDDSSTAALSKVGKDDTNPMNGTKYSDSFKGTVIGDNFYYIDLAQYVCAESVAGKATLDKVRAAFTSAIITQ